MKPTALALLACLWAAPIAAQDAGGDAAEGERLFQRHCVSCHVIVDGEGRTLAGRNARTGPNLFGIAGARIGSVPDFGQYGEGLIALRDRGMVWDAASFAAYLQDPTVWLRETLDDRRARGRMAFRIGSAQEALDIYAYLAAHGD